MPNISSASELISYMSLSNPSPNATYTITDDLDMSVLTDPMDTSATFTLKAIDGKKIENLYCPLFENVGDGTRFENITILEPEIYYESPTGSAGAFLMEGNGITFTNCHVKGGIVMGEFNTSTPDLSVGGLAGYLTGWNTIDRCSNSAMVTVERSAAESYQVEIFANVGGIIGQIFGDEADLDHTHVSVITNCVNTGTIYAGSTSATPDYVYFYLAGIVGGAQQTRIVDCMNDGVVYNAKSSFRYTDVGAGIAAFFVPGAQYGNHGSASNAASGTMGQGSVIYCRNKGGISAGSAAGIANETYGTKGTYVTNLSWNVNDADITAGVYATGLFYQANGIIQHCRVLDGVTISSDILAYGLVYNFLYMLSLNYVGAITLKGTWINPICESSQAYNYEHVGDVYDNYYSENIQYIDPSNYRPINCRTDDNLYAHNVCEEGIPFDDSCPDGSERKQSADDMVCVDPKCAFCDNPISVGQVVEPLANTTPTPTDAKIVPAVLRSSRDTGLPDGMSTRMSELIASIANMQSTMSGISNLEADIVSSAMASVDPLSPDMAQINDSVGAVVDRLTDINKPLACSLCCVAETLIPGCLLPTDDGDSGGGQDCEDCGPPPVNKEYCGYVQTLTATTGIGINGLLYTLTNKTTGAVVFQDMPTLENGLLPLTGLPAGTYTLTAQSPDSSDIWADDAHSPYTLTVGTNGRFTVTYKDGNQTVEVNQLTLARRLADPEKVRNMHEPLGSIVPGFIEGLNNIGWLDAEPELANGTLRRPLVDDAPIPRHIPAVYDIPADETPPLVSIVVPVWNDTGRDGSLLTRALDSCYNQTLCEIEVIMVNDASPNPTDKDIMARFEAAYPLMFHAIYLSENMGQGEARNQGIDAAQGEFVTFLDSDDTLAPEFCEKLYQHAKAQDADLVFTDCDYNGRRQSIFGAMDSDNPYGPLRLSRYVSWGALYRRQFAVDHDLYFLNTNHEAMSNALWPAYGAKIARVRETLYHYKTQDGSISTGSQFDKTPAWVKMAKAFCARVSEFGNPQLEREYCAFILEKLVNAVNHRPDTPEAMQDAALTMVDIARRMDSVETLRDLYMPDSVRAAMTAATRRAELPPETARAQKLSARRGRDGENR
ncbi:hypothetical protein AGMMS49992_02920 [Clostridia bacterium]|nr:hypothetical protein AGMMS49992_02920 [Clostridia bacterium]